MLYHISVTRKAEKQLVKIPNEHRIRIFAAIRLLGDSETWRDVRRLVNHKYGYRLRVGRYRILFDATDDLNIEINEIIIEEVVKRDERTY